jgi:y4mF family transcriptional regulator
MTNREINPISEFVKKKRKQVKLTQVQLAKKAGVGLRFVRELEQGKQSLRCDIVNQVLTLFGSQLVPAQPSIEQQK